MRKTDVVCLGTVKLGIPPYGFSSQSNFSEPDPIAFLKQVELSGIRRFDTSPRYGKSEEILGQYVLQATMTPVISSKIDNLKTGNPDMPIKMRKSVEASLSKLNVQRLDICYLHQNDLSIISDPYIHEGLVLLKQENLVRYTGASLYTFKECEYAISSGVFDFIQIPVNVFNVAFYSEFIKSNTCAVRFAARSLLLQGILVNRSEIRSRIRYNRQILSYLNQLDRLAGEYGLSTLEMSLAFVFSLKHIDHYLIGTTSIENLKKDIQCLYLELPSELSERILEIASQSKIWTDPRSWN